MIYQKDCIERAMQHKQLKLEFNLETQKSSERYISIKMTESSAFSKKKFSQKKNHLFVAKANIIQ